MLPSRRRHRRAYVLCTSKPCTASLTVCQARYSSATLEVWSPTRREYLPVSGTLDSGTRQNWISAEVAHRIRVQRFERIQSDVLLDFQSRPFQASRRLQLTWRGSKSRQTRESWFFVIENCPFDILIGGDLLFSQGIYIFNEAALLFFNRPATEGNISLTKFQPSY